MKKFALALAALMMGTLLAACGGTTSQAPSAAQPGSQAASAGEESASGGGVLIMATEATFPPYEYMDGTEIVGVDVDIAREIAKELNMELKIENMEFDAIIPAVSSGKADFGAAGLSITDERLEQVDFSIVYATSMQVILTRDDSGIAGEADLDGRIVGVQTGTVADLALTDDYPEVQVERYSRYTDALLALNNGQVDALLLDLLPAKTLQQQGENLIICEKELFTDEYAFCVQKGNTELLEVIDRVLQRLMDEGKIQEYTTAHLPTE